jgi:hypothetical protein
MIMILNPDDGRKKHLRLLCPSCGTEGRLLEVITGGRIEREILEITRDEEGRVLVDTEAEELTEGQVSYMCAECRAPLCSKCQDLPRYLPEAQGADVGDAT